MERIFKLSKRVLLIMLLPILFVGFTDDSYGAKKKKKKKHKITKVRKYNPTKTKADALNTIRTNSEELSELFGLEPALDSLALKPNIIDAEDSELYEVDRCGLDVEEEGEDWAELEREDDVVVDMDNFKMLWMNFMFAGTDSGNEIIQCGIAKQDIMNEVMELLGTPYLFGGNSDRAIDCSAFVRSIFQRTGNILLPRTAREQNTVGIKVSRKNLEFGDLVFFNTRRKVRVSHVGIYLGDNLFVHASSRYGVTVSSLESEYYSKRLLGGKRLTQKDVARLSMDNRKAYLEQ